MDYQIDKKYYMIRRPELLKGFDKESQYWRPVIAKKFGKEFTNIVLREAHGEFETLIPQIPYIGGNENHLTEELIGSVRYLAFYKAMKKHRKTAEETGKILYDAILARIDEPRSPVPPAKRLTTKQLMERRRKRAEKSQERLYPQDYVYEFVIGDGKEFDYGYDFSECAAQKFYHAQGADEFMPFYCYLDFPRSMVDGSGLSRTMTLSEGHEKCNHRSKEGREVKLERPPPFWGEKTAG